MEQIKTLPTWQHKKLLPYGIKSAKEKPNYTPKRWNSSTPDERSLVELEKSFNKSYYLDG